MSTVKKTVLKVNINCEQCKKDLLKTVTKLSGISQVTAEGGKGTLTVVGNVDPFLIVKALRKAGKFAEFVSVGSPKPPEKILIPVILPSYCNDCSFVPVGYAPYGGYHNGGSGCNIL